MAEEKQTQGHKKILLYIEDLIRNKNFIRFIKRIRRLRKQDPWPEGMYVDWTPEEQKKHDYINDEIGGIIADNEKLRKRCKKLFMDDEFRIKENLALIFGLDGDAVNLAIAKFDKNANYEKSALLNYEPDMCQIIDMNDEMRNPFNKGEDCLYMRRDLQLLYASHPIAIYINKRASKRDVLDFIEKKWQKIENMRYDDEQKVLKIRERKHDQDMVDFIWENQGLSRKQIIKKLDEKFPNHGLVYYEINKIIQIERIKRLIY